MARHGKALKGLLERYFQKIHNLPGWGIDPARAL